jgi:hypothetical protein
MVNAMKTVLHLRERSRMFIIALSCIAVLRPALCAAQQDQPSGQSAEATQVAPSTEPTPVIPPGREDLLAEMLGRGVTLPGECRFTSGQVKADTVTATYACSTGEVVVTLRHPTKGTSDATRTEQFALSVESGAPPAGLTAELMSRIRSREGEFEWTWLSLPDREQESGAAIAPVAAVAAVAIAIAAVLLWLVLRRRGRQGASQS